MGTILPLKLALLTPSLGQGAAQQTHRYEPGEDMEGPCTYLSPSCVWLAEESRISIRDFLSGQSLQAVSHLSVGVRPQTKAAGPFLPVLPLLNT